MTTTSCFIEPLDVLFLRGNQLFGEPGSYGEALMPPWPSVPGAPLDTPDREVLPCFGPSPPPTPTLA